MAFASEVHPDGISILVVSNDRPNLYSRSRILSQADYRVIQASTAEEALHIVASTPPELIVLDVNLPNIDGLEVCRRLKTDPKTSHIMVLQVSSSRSSKKEDLAVEGEADDYLIEPIDPLDLVTTVRVLLRLSDRKRKSGLVRQQQLVKDTIGTYRAMFANATDGIAMMDPHGRYIEQNLAHWVMLGHSNEDLLGQTPAFHLGEDTFQRVVKELIDTGRFQGEIRSRRKDGQWIDVALSAFGIYGDTGEVLCYVEMKRDMTARNQREAAMLAAHDTFRQLVERSPFGVYVVDANFNLVQVSAGAQKVFENVRPLLGRDFAEVLRLIWPEPFAGEAIRLFRYTLETGESYHAPSTVEQRRDSGDVESYDWKIERITMPDGRYGVVCHFYDLSERQRYEQALRESEERFHNMANNAPVMVWVTEPDGACSFLSRSWYDFTGQTPETGLGFGWINAVHPDDRLAAEQTFVQANNTHRSFRLEYRLRKHDGEYGWAIDAAVPRFSAEGDFLGYIGSVIDITERKQAEQALHQSEERFKQLSTSLPLLAWTCAPHGECDFLSRQWIEYTGIPESVQLGYGWLNQLHPADRAATMQAWEASRQADSDFHVEFRIRRHDGVYRWFDTKAVRARAENGRTLKWYGFNTDITERKQTEEALRDSEARFRNLADHISQFAWMADAKGWIFWYNKRWFDYTGTTLEQMQGWGWRMVHHPDHLDRVIEKWQKALEAGEGWEDTFPLRGRVGTYRWFLSRALPIRDSDGLIVRWFGTNTDVTELREAEKAQAHLAAIVTSSDDAIVSKDLTGIITSWNRGAERLFGYTEQETIGRPITMLMPPDRIAEEHEILSSVKRGESVEHYETVRVRKDRTLLDISLTVSPIMDEQGRIIGASKVARDITERKRQEEELRRLKDELEVRVQERTRELLATQGRLMTVTSQLSLTEQRERRKLARDLHDYLAQMLIVGRMKTSMLKKQLPHDSATTTLSQDLDKVFQQSLEYTRTLIAELSPPSLQESGLPAALKWLSERFQKDGLTVEVQTDCAFVPLSEEQAVVVFQAVRELLFNVMKHAGVDRATVTVSFGEGDILHVSVADGGKGLAPEVLQRSAEPGHLGLVSVRERFRAMGGRVDVQSPPGNGTTVTLLLPLANSAETKVLSAQFPETQGSAFRAQNPVLPKRAVVRVLLVDDHKLMRQELRDILAANDRIRVVGEAGTGDEALLLAANVAPDVVITDINLPSVNGIEMTKRFKSLHPQTVVIGLSAHTEEHMKRDILSSGAEILLSKEYAADELVPAILRCCDGRGADR